MEEQLSKKMETEEGGNFTLPLGWAVATIMNFFKSS